jgi:hypothetical protein
LLRLRIAARDEVSRLSFLAASSPSLADQMLLFLVPLVVFQVTQRRGVVGLRLRGRDLSALSVVSRVRRALRPNFAAQAAARAARSFAR